MILYHFTSLYNLGNVGPENILAVGLKPFPVHDYPEDIQAKIPEAVWLTSNPEHTVASMSSYDEVRLTVVIPSTDKRLVRWYKWVRKHCPHLVEIMEKTSRENNLGAEGWYLYLGPVPLGRIRAVEHARR
jgi:hypothetical protein